MVDRQAALAEFLQQSGWADATRIRLAGDASSRRYERLRLPDDSAAILMDAPAAQGHDLDRFLKIGAFLDSVGLSAPQPIAADTANGFAIIEDFGDAVFARLIERDPEREMPLYRKAVDVLLRLHSADPPPGLRQPTPGDLAGMIDPARDWYAPGPMGRNGRDVWAEIEAGFLRILQCCLTARPVIALRDYHSENLIWLPRRRGARRVGLLDFQDAFLADPVYDLVSLLQDARRDLGSGLEDRVKLLFRTESRYDPDAFETVYAALGAQRNLRILGIFARLSRTNGRPAYVDLIPRVWRHLMRDLLAPGLRPVAPLLLAALPEPTAEHLRFLKEPCETAPTP